MSSAPAPPASPDQPPTTPPREPRLIPPPARGRRDKRLARMAATGGARVDRVNRTALLLLGLVLVAAGVLGLLLFNGDLHAIQPDHLYRNWVADARGAQDLSAAIALAICLVVLLVTARWALAQLRPVSDGERVGSVRLADGADGRTRLGAATLARAATADLTGRPGVTSGRVRIRAVRPTLRVQMLVEMDLVADPDEVLAQADEVLHHLLVALERADGDTDSEIRLRFSRSARTPEARRVS